MTSLPRLPRVDGLRRALVAPAQQPEIASRTNLKERL